ncbi:hypothetical protein GJV85_09990 [Sulfurimonas aquatica]|uniref:Protein BatD n=1 Tax=Sulfurimonas aquatica TaxID=2672570 RepID=A0A975B1K0_9BACT|nr:BatD family protein [Sulfurimonas aquatica]QSZ42423.1 hypothetical protein GJV85_09990 [Sulfurimonas aquatica]
MNNTLGRYIILFTLLFLTLDANNKLATFDLISNKYTPYIKEAVEIKLTTQQVDRELNMFYFLKPKESSEYHIVLLNKKAEEPEYHYKKAEYIYLLFPLKSGEIKVEFDFTIKVASDEAVAQVFQGSRDNVKWIETIDTKVNLTPITLHVKELKKEVDLVGDFTITSELKNSSIHSYESANIVYTLNGVGYHNFSTTPINSIENVELFSDITKHYDKATSQGYDIHRDFNYALVSANSFIVPSQKIECYSPKKDTYYTLSTQEYKVDVKQMGISTLVDEVDHPKNSNDYRYLLDYLIYISIFIAGFISAKLIPSNFTYYNDEFKDIKDSKNAKELLYLLLHKYYKQEFKDQYEILNDIVYNKKNKSEYKKVKQEVLKRLKK